MTSLRCAEVARFGPAGASPRRLQTLVLPAQGGPAVASDEAAALRHRQACRARKTRDGVAARQTAGPRLQTSPARP